MQFQLVNKKILSSTFLERICYYYQATYEENIAPNHLKVIYD